MEFDKSRIYTAVNADELAIGSKCILGDTIQDLRQKIQGGFCADDCAEDYFRYLSEIYDDDRVERFVANNCAYIYAYLIEPPAEVGFRNKEKISEKIDDLQIVHLSLRDIKEIALYAGLTIDTENIPDDDTDDEYTLYYSRSGIKFSDDGAYHIAMRSGYEDANEFMPIGREITP